MGSPIILVVKAMDHQSGISGFDSRSGQENFLDTLGVVYHCACLTIYKFMQWQGKESPSINDCGSARRTLS